MTAETRPCPGCGEEYPVEADSGAAHPYIGASPGCWALYSEVLGREYSDFTYMRGHQYTVDAYAVQHPGKPGPRSAQSVAVHLISLYAMLACGISPAEVSRIRSQATGAGLDFHWLEPPADRGEITVRTVYAAPDAAAHVALVQQWARQMWQIWQPHHPQIQAWGRALGVTPP